LVNKNVCSSRQGAVAGGFLPGEPTDGEGMVQPSIEANEIVTIRLHRLHFNSIPSCCNLAINWPHSQRASCSAASRRASGFAVMCVPVRIAVELLIEIENDY
jgi:hypothetical protein